MLHQNCTKILFYKKTPLKNGLNTDFFKRIEIMLYGHPHQPEKSDLSGFFLFLSKIKIRHTHFSKRSMCMPFLWDKHFLLSCRFQHNKTTVMFNMHLVKILKSTFVKMIIQYHLLHYPHNLFHKCGYLYPYRLRHPRYMPMHCSDRLIEPYIYIQWLHLH